MATAAQKVEKLMDENNVVVFSKSYCPYCRATKQTLDELNAIYLAIELDKEADGTALQDAVEKLTGQRTVPNVLIQRNHIGGNSDIQSLNKDGKLADLLKQCGAIKA
ncbi:glutaredoxin 3 [Ophiocordyceps camponoti-floridani]|uniref:Glutaredoxin 3 n=1 Tax=Ophiocordyceps camponoti-floridani TaxID=2030778 RepID=A0A8H4Q5F5_9HYPO|nr:glutaredoxin 3 [Ophiocordyceps camponoti-floridani]